MRSFRCACGRPVYFENDRCLGCDRVLAFDPRRLALRPLRPEDRYCASHANPRSCNWLTFEGALCVACGLNEMVPDLSDPRRLALFREVEKAKRRLLYGLLALGLPVHSRANHPDGLAFRILADARLDGGEVDAAAADAVLTAHTEGCITVNLLEADPCLRERMREAMNEPYRTLLGHFRHESGHYYWHRLVGQVVGQGDAAERFRALFGDERAPYQERMAAYYRDGPPADWARTHITAYQASHPWEDFAECWAHYLHIVDTLETAAHAGLGFAGEAARDPFAAGLGVDDLLDDWSRLCPALNDLNRSMGQADAYPFAVPPPARAKLAFVHDLIRASGRAGERPGSCPAGASSACP